MGNLESPISLTLLAACLWTVGCSWSSQRKPTQRLGEIHTESLWADGGAEILLWGNSANHGATVLPNCFNERKKSTTPSPMTAECSEEVTQKQALCSQDCLCVCNPEGMLTYSYPQPQQNQEILLNKLHVMILWESNGFKLVLWVT